MTATSNASGAAIRRPRKDTVTLCRFCTAKISVAATKTPYQGHVEPTHGLPPWVDWVGRKLE